MCPIDILLEGCDAGDKYINNCLFSKKMLLYVSFMDDNYHINQSQYIRFVDDCLCEYKYDYYKGKLVINHVDIMYVMEMKVERNFKDDWCIVEVLYDRNMEMLFVVKKDDKIRAKIRLVLRLKPSKNDFDKLLAKL